MSELNTRIPNYIENMAKNKFFELKEYFELKDFDGGTTASLKDKLKTIINETVDAGIVYNQDALDVLSNEKNFMLAIKLAHKKYPEIIPTNIEAGDILEFYDKVNKIEGREGPFYHENIIKKLGEIGFDDSFGMYVDANTDQVFQEGVLKDIGLDMYGLARDVVKHYMEQTILPNATKILQATIYENIQANIFNKYENKDLNNLDEKEQAKLIFSIQAVALDNLASNGRDSNVIKFINEKVPQDIKDQVLDLIKKDLETTKEVTPIDFLGSSLNKFKISNLDFIEKEQDVLVGILVDKQKDIPKERIHFLQDAALHVTSRDEFFNKQKNVENTKTKTKDNQLDVG